MKKFAIILAALLLALSVCSCKNNNNPEDTSGNSVIINPNGSTSQNGENNTEGDDSSTTEVDIPSTEKTFEDRNETVYIISKAGAVNLRSDTVISAETIVKSENNGYELKRTGVSTDDENEWSRVIYNDQVCYIKSKFVTTLKNLDEGFNDVSKTLIAKGNIWVRIAPDYIHEEVGAIKPGAEIKVIAEKEGWYKIEFEDTYTEKGEYYISSKADLFKTEESTTAE